LEQPTKRKTKDKNKSFFIRKSWVKGLFSHIRKKWKK